MKHFLIASTLMLMTALGANAQDNTHKITLYSTNQPAVLHMRNGRDVKNLQTNISLKNGALLFMRGTTVMELDMDLLAGVDFGQDYYLNIGNQLALLIDSVGDNRLYCITLVDIESYKNMLVNDRVITNLDIQHQGLLDGHLDFQSLEGTVDKNSLPIIRQYYYLYNGKLVKVHERDIQRALPKSKKRAFKTILSLPDFSWTKPESLMTMLKAISEEEEE